MRRDDKNKHQQETTLVGSDESLKLVCGWLKLNHERYKPVEQDFETLKVEGRPERGGIGSEKLSKKEVQKQTAGAQHLGGLERKLLPKKQQTPTNQKRPLNDDSLPDEDIDKLTIKRSKVECSITDELQNYAATKRKKQRKKKKKGGNTGTTPTMSPRAAPNSVLPGPDD
eukprot:TRINITY_DN23740_c0_g1_i1.p1 TRINITY_DN23740_c0_g1~~TRINITY_DN23740_c0_g1_i1.p1  ORF type:complete len:186 (+),score=41.68 TRINITY_DN23740_c0_g1_i1:50-559(+)